MDDREIRDLMGSLRPRTSPPGLDARILSEAESAARRARSRRRFRIGIGVAGAAAAAALLVVAGWRLAGPAERSGENRGGGDRAAAERAVPEPDEPLATAASAKATLLELRIERLRRMALASNDAEDALSKLESLRRELETIEEVYIDTVPAAYTAERDTVGSEEETNDEKQTRLERGHRGSNPRRSGARGV